MKYKNVNNNRVGLSFGITSAIITTLGIILGLGIATQSKIVIILGVLVIAISDSLSDALGIHISEESESEHTQKQIWQATISTLLTKIFTSLLFIFPFLFFEINNAIYFSIILGLVLLSLLSYRIAKINKDNWKKVVLEHNFVALVVIIVSYYLGKLVNINFF